MEDQILDNMDIERERGITIKARAVTMNYTAKDGRTYEFNLIDTPGHVDFAYEVSRSLAACEGAILVVDATQGVEAQTLANTYMALEHDLELVPILNKIDLPSAHPDEVAQEVEDVISYKGVIVYIRVFEGTVKPGDTIRLMATGAEFTLVEVGHMGATNLTPCAQLQAGEVGYLTASIKTVQDTRVGDTVTLASNPTPEALPGYRQVKPMVFCGIYPADGAKYPDLKDALEKLQLNDASLTFELETSAALGFGFRCGFLGLLHMEIITERLEREFDLDIITTTPSVRYRLTLTDGTVEMIDNPSSYPDPSNIVKQEEPFVDVHLYTPNDYVGGLMDLCQNKRGVLIDMKYLDDVRVDLHYALPLGEIVYDFFDAIKSRSRGYASYDYEFKEYRESDLVKLDFLLNGDPVDALSMIVFRDNAYAKGRRICERRKAKRRCASWAASPFPAKLSPPCSSWTATTIDRFPIQRQNAADRFVCGIFRSVIPFSNLSDSPAETSCTGKYGPVRCPAPSSAAFPAERGCPGAAGSGLCCARSNPRRQHRCTCRPDKSCWRPPGRTPSRRRSAGASSCRSGPLWWCCSRSSIPGGACCVPCGAAMPRNSPGRRALPRWGCGRPGSRCSPG